MKKNLDITQPPYREQILSVSGPFVKSRFHCILFVVGSLPYSETFFSGYSGFPLPSKTNISKNQFDQESGRRITTLWMCYLQIIIYFFILFYFFCIHVLLTKSYKVDKPFLFTSSKDSDYLVL